MSPTHPAPGRDQRGASLIEAPLAIVVFAFIALGVVGFGQVLLAYQHLTGATRAAARYASKNDYDPTVATPTGARRPTTSQVKDFATSTASPLSLSSVQVLDVSGAPVENANAAVGSQVRVQAEADVNSGPYALVSGLANAVGNVFGAQVLPVPFRIHSEGVALYE